MGTHEVTKPHLVSAIITGWVLVALVWLIFGFLANNYVLYIPLLLAYAIWRRDPVIAAGQGFGLLVYLRNLALIRRQGTPRADS